MKQIVLPFPFVWFTIRVEPAALARRRALVLAPQSPVTIARAALEPLIGSRLMQDIGLDRSRMD